jgi:hypothetical protein
MDRHHFGYVQAKCSGEDGDDASDGTGNAGSREKNTIGAEAPPFQADKGDIVRTLFAFRTDSDTPIEIDKGVQGSVIRTSENGDAEIKFDGIDQEQLVCRENFHALTKEVALGDKVRADENFMTDSDTPIQIEEGVHGRVIRINEDGDAKIQFDGIEQEQLVCRRNLKLLTKEQNERNRFESSASVQDALMEEVQRRKTRKSTAADLAQVSSRDQHLQNVKRKQTQSDFETLAPFRAKPEESAEQYFDWPEYPDIIKLMADFDYDSSGTIPRECFEGVISDIFPQWSNEDKTLLLDGCPHTRKTEVEYAGFLQWLAAPT